MTTITVNMPADHGHAIPRGARVAAKVFIAIARWMTSPPKRRAMSRAEEAAEVRQMAYEMQQTDPALASELICAAARHESLGER